MREINGVPILYIREKFMNWGNEPRPTKDSADRFEEAIDKYLILPTFKISENIHDISMVNVTEDVHLVMRIIAQYHMEKVFEAMKIDMNDGNVAGEKGTPYRLIKCWTGSNLEDDTEMMSGRWTHRPNITDFDNTNTVNFPITKRVDVVSVCSHHIAPFSTMFRPDSYAIVSYIPEGKILGISKLQRLVDWCSRRGQLQEGLTELIYKEVSKAASTESVLVRLYNLTHTCEKLRGTQAHDGAFTSEYYGGAFNDAQTRNQIKE